MLGLSYLQLAGNQLLSMDYLRCLSTCDKAISHFRVGMLNYIGTMEIKFLAQFHSGKLEDAIQTVEPVLTLSSIRQNPIYLAKWEYYKTVILYKQGKFKEAFLHIQRCNDLYEDKEGWGIGLRILMIMILLRRNLNDIIDNEIDNFRRMLAKLKKMGLVSKRALLIFKIISQLPKYDYSLKLLVFHFKPELELLDNNIIDYGWYVKGYELIRIEKEIII
jgi:tetratricopeptide (TPR) repeat protein